MPQLAVLLALLVLLRIATAFEVHTDGPFDPLSLLSLGFILIGGHAMGELFRRARLPALLGYFAAGIVFGPDVSAIALGNSSWAPIGVGALGDLGLVKVLAIGVIGTLGGCEIKIAELKEGLTKIAAICGSVFVLVLPTVVVVVIATSFALPSVTPFLAGTPLETRIAAALMFGALAVGMSPAATLALLQEVHARGRFTNLVLGVVVLGDLILVATFLLLLALAKLLVSPEGLSMASLLLEFPLIAAEFGWALGLGIALGVAYIAYLRFIGRETLLFSLAAIFVTSYVAALVHAETLLTFLVAGFVVQNASKHGHTLAETFERVSLPVFIVYFTGQAASLDLEAVTRYLPLTLLLVVVRSTLFVSGIRLGARAAKVSDDTRKQLQLSFFSQGGVDLALAAMVAEALPGVGPEIQTVTVATVLFYVIGGPPLLARALDRMGESAAGRERGAAELEHGRVQQPRAKSPPSDALSEVQVSDPTLAAVMLELREELRRELSEGIVAQTARRAESRRAFIASLLADLGRAAPEDRDVIVLDYSRRWDAHATPPLDAEEFTALVDRLGRRVDYATSHRTGPPRARNVPLGRLWRFHVTLGLPIAFWSRASPPEATIWESVCTCLRTPAAALDQGPALLAGLATSDHDHEHALSEALRGAWASFAEAVRVVGTLQSRAWRQRPSVRHDAARAALAESSERLQDDRRVTRAICDAFRAEAEARHVVNVGRRTFTVLDAQLEAALQDARSDLARLAAAATGSQASWERIGEDLEALGLRLEQLHHDVHDHPLRRTNGLAAALDELPDQLEPTRARAEQPIDLRAWLDVTFVRRLELARASAETQLDQGLPSIAGLVEKARRVAAYHHEHAASEPEDDFGGRVGALLVRAEEELRTLVARLRHETARSIDDAAEEALDAIVRQRWNDIRRKSSADAAVRQLRHSVRTHLSRRFDALVEVLTQLDHRPSKASLATSRALLFSPQTAHPDAYARLFSAVPAESVALFVPRSREADVRAALATRRGAVLVYGDPGSGRSTLVRQVLREERRDATWIRLTPDRERESDVATELAPALLGRVAHRRTGLDFVTLQAEVSAAATRPDTLIVVENAERLFRQTSAGVACMRRFLTLVEHSAAHVQWLVLMGQSAKIWLEPMLGLSTRFGASIHVPGVGGDTLRRILESRHDVSGYPLRVVGRWPTLHECLHAPGFAVALFRSPERALYLALAIASQGNVRHAIRMWTAMIRLADGTFTIPVLPTEPLPLLDSLPLPAKLVLRTLLMFGALHRSEVTDEAALRTLAERGLVEVGDGSERALVEIPINLIAPLHRALREDMLL